MSEHYPKLRVRTTAGYVVIRDGLTFDFYMKRHHLDVLPGVLRLLEEYRAAAGPAALGTYWDSEGEIQVLDAAGWEGNLKKLREGSIICLGDALGEESRHRFEYYGKSPSFPMVEFSPNWTTAVTCWLPTEYLEEHGPAAVRALALRMAEPLPFCSGYVGLLLSSEPDVVGVGNAVKKLSFRYPGMDIPGVSWLSWNLGTRVRGPAWMTFLGQPVLGELGGAAGLRQKLRTPGTTVEELGGDRAVVTLGEWPEAGDAERGEELPAYRELARVLEPWLFHDKVPLCLFTEEEQLRWERRFLD